MRMTQVLSGLITTQALSSGVAVDAPKVAAAAASPEPVAKGRVKPRASPPPAMAELTMNLRREGLVTTFVVFFMIGLPWFYALALALAVPVLLPAASSSAARCIPARTRW